MQAESTALSSGKN